MSDVSNAEIGHNPFVKYDTPTPTTTSREISLHDQLEAMHRFYEIFAHMSEQLPAKSPTSDRINPNDNNAELTTL